MSPLFWATLAIGGTTLIGTAFGFLFSRVSARANDAVTAFAAGIMLSAAAFGLFVPAMDMVRGAQTLVLAAGALTGVLFLRLIGRVSARFGHGGGLQLHPELLFVLAIAIHKLPEGMAGGVGLNGMDLGPAITVVIGLSLQNLPEGIVMIPPLIAAGVRRSRAAVIALLTGLLNAAGVLIGYLWGAISLSVLPFALAFAGGAMLDVILRQMVPQVAAAGRLKHGTLISLVGFILMAMVNVAFA